MDQPTQTISRKRLWLRRSLYAVAFTVGVIGVALWVVTRSWFIVAQIKPELAARLGGDVSIASAAYEGGGRFVLRDVVLRVPRHVGEAGELLKVAQARIRVDEGKLYRGAIELKDIELDGVLLRLAESLDDAGEFTFMALDPQWEPDDADPVAALPRLEVRSATVEYGTHGRDGYEAHARRHLAGLMEPDPTAWRSYYLRLSEIDETGADVVGGILVQGTWNVETNEHNANVGGLVLDRTAHEMVPQAVRWWWDHLDLEGRLANARFEWREGRPLSVVFEVENVGITLPVETNELWARYHAGQVIPHSARPRVRVHSGTIRFEDNDIIIDEPLVGELRSEDIQGDGPAAVSVPWAVKVTIRDLRPGHWDDREAWINDMLVTVPFEMEFSVKDFMILPDEDGNLPPVDLPLPIAQALQRFHLTDFGLTTHIVVRRDVSGTLTMSGEVRVSEASGAYAEFPYPLHSIEATITFVNERVRIESLRGIAPSGAVVNIEGSIDSLGREAEVELRLTTERAVLDEHLRAAMRFKNLAFFDALMNIPAKQALRASGRMDAASDERSEEDAEGRPESAPFILGGDVALDLRIHRAAGPDQPTDVTGTIHIHSLGMVYERFPYPFTVTGGSLHLERDGVSIIDDEYGRGLPIVTVGGGTGFVSGSVHARRVNGELRAMPDLTVKVENDRMNPLITAAIPLGRADQGDLEEVEVEGDSHKWPGGYVSKPVALLESARLSGLLDYNGRIYTDDDGEVGYEFTVDLRGQARPGAELAEKLGEAGLLWPPDLVIDHVEAHVFVTNGEITLVKFDGDHEHGLIGASGSINWMEDETRTALDIELIDLELDRYLIDLLPTENAEALLRLWDRYQPSGKFNAKLEFRALGETIDPPRLLIDPSGARVLLDDEPVLLSRESGGLTLTDGRVTFDDLAVVFLRQDGAISDGSVLFNGSYGLADDEDGRDLSIRAVWTEGRFESPVIVEAVRLIGAESHLREFERLNPRGVFSAEFSYASPVGGRPRTYGLSVQPHTLTIEVGEATLEAEMHEGSRITLRDDVIDIHHVSGTLGGEAFILNGSIETGELTRIDFDTVAFDGRLMNEQVQSILPRGVREMFETIKFADGPRTVVEGSRLTLAQRAKGDWGAWDAHFIGVLRTEGASFDAGMKVTDFDGALTVVFDEVATGDGSAATRLEIDVVGERLQLAGRGLTNLHAPGIALSEDGRSIRVPEVRAESYGGLLWAEADIGLADGQPYEARLELVGASVAGLMSGDAGNARQARSRRQGTVNAGVRLSGVAGDAASRSGRGVIRAVGGSIENVPFILQLMQVLQLSLPLGGALDNAHVEFLIDGDTAIFERILLESTLGNVANLSLFGDGEMNLRTLELRTQFRSRGGTLLIRDLVGGIGDQLYGIEIVGTLLKPKARVVALPGLTQQSSARPRVQQRATAAVGAPEAQ